VSPPAIGTRVLALTRFGGHSSMVVIPARRAVPLPDGVDLVAAAGIPVVYLTAWIMLVWLGNVHAGEKVLVHAAAGGVGQAALQICKWRGAQVIGTASPGKHARLRELGVESCIDYTSQDFEAEVKRLTDGRGVDLVLDAVGGASFKKSYACLAPLGRLFMFGGSSFAPGESRSIPSVLRAYFGLPKFKPFAMMNQNKGVFGVNMGHLWSEDEKLSVMMREIVDLCAKKVLDPVIDQTYPFDKAGEAHQRIKDRKNFGKVLLVP
jgi:NADPH:quinone reductase-like Zn-dependent oxidoreductase